MFGNPFGCVSNYWKTLRNRAPSDYLNSPPPAPQSYMGNGASFPQQQQQDDPMDEDENDAHAMIIADGEQSLAEGLTRYSKEPRGPLLDTRAKFQECRENMEILSFSTPTRTVDDAYAGYQAKSMASDIKLEEKKRQIASLEQEMRDVSTENAIDQTEIRMCSKSAAAVSLQAAEVALTWADDAETAVAEAEEAALGVGGDLGALRRQPLTDEENQMVEQALRFGGDEEQVQEMFNIPIKRKDIKSLQPATWLNDEVINFWMELLNERTNTGGTKTVHFFNTFFTAKLNEGGYCYRNVRRWTKRPDRITGKPVDIFALDKVIMPVHVGQMHWCLAVMYMQEKRVQYYDSMAGSGKAQLDNLLKYLVDEAKNKKDETLDPTEWTAVPTQMSETPQQHNGCDCGVFTCIGADHIAAGEGLNYSQDDMPHFRRRMMIRILQGKLEGEDGD